MKQWIKSPRVRLLLLAAVVSLLAGAVTVTEGASYYSFGFPTTFLIVSKQAGFPRWGLNPLQLAGNVVSIWLILFCLSKLLGRLASMVRKNKDAT